MSQDNRGDHRTKTARLNDDSQLIDAAEDPPFAAGEQEGRAGGNLQTDVGTQAEEERATDPDAQESVTKDDHIAHGQGSSPPHPAREVGTERD